MISRILYYLSSLPTLIGQINNWYALPTLLLKKEGLIIRLKNGCQFKVRSLMDVWIVKESCLDRDYERNGTVIQDGWTVIDIGSGIGEFAILTAWEKPNCRVFAYEPFPESFALLQENLTLNETKNVQAFQTAVSATSGPLTLATTGAAVQHTTTGSQISGSADSFIEVQALSFADLFAANDISRCHFLKIDCEGCEFELLLNASPAVLAQIDHICLEYHNGFTAHNHTELAAHLQENGFQVTTTPNPVHDYLGFLYAHR